MAPPESLTLSSRAPSGRRLARQSQRNIGYSDSRQSKSVDGREIRCASAAADGLTNLVPPAVYALTNLLPPSATTVNFSFGFIKGPSGKNARSRLEKKRQRAGGSPGLSSSKSSSTIERVVSGEVDNAAPVNTSHPTMRKVSFMGEHSLIVLRGRSAIRGE